MIEFEDLNVYDTLLLLSNNSVFHAVTDINIYNDNSVITNIVARDKTFNIFMLNRYSN